MTITLPSELAGLTVEAYVERLIREEDVWATLSEPTLTEDSPDFAEIQAAIDEGLTPAEAGASVPAHQVFAQLRAKYGVSD